MGYAEELGRICGDGADEITQAAGFFAGVHAAQGQFQFRRCQPSLDGWRIIPKLRIPLQSGVECSDLFATRIDRIRHARTLPRVFASQREWLIAVVHAITGACDATRQILIAHWKDRLIEIADLFKDGFGQSKTWEAV